MEQSVRELITSSGWKHVATHLQRDILLLEEHILSGDIKDIEEYKRVVDKRDNLKSLLDYPSRIVAEPERSVTHELNIDPYDSTEDLKQKQKQTG